MERRWEQVRKKTIPRANGFEKVAWHWKLEHGTEMPSQSFKYNKVVHFIKCVLERVNKNYKS